MKSKLTEADLLNWWLKKYHNTSLEEVFKLHPDWTNDNPEYSSHIFYEAYQVTQEQHDEWQAWALEAFRKNFKLSKKLAERSFAYTYLNTSPMVLEQKQ
jgi:hypothetical protein